MTTYVVHDATGRAVSIDTKVADPLPAGLTAAPLTDLDADALRTGTGQWDPTTRTVIAREVVTVPTAEDRIAAAATALAALGGITAPVLAADVLDVLDDVRTALGGQ